MDLSLDPKPTLDLNFALFYFIHFLSSVSLFCFTVQYQNKFISSETLVDSKADYFLLQPGYQREEQHIV